MSQRQPRSVRIAWARIDARWERQERLGLMLAQTEKNQGAIPGKTGAKGEPVLDPTPTLAEIGID